MKRVNIGKCVSKVDTWNPATSKGEDSFRYIDLSAVDKDAKRIMLDLVGEIDCENAPSRARQLVSAGDILVSTVRPNLNGIAIVDDELEGATASTGYCVLRTNPEMLYSRYLFHWVQSEAFVSDMVKKATGASYPAVSDKIIKESEIPLPPLSEQKRIAGILDAADRLRQQDKALIGCYNQLAQSVFLEMFGDPVRNERGWEMKELGNVSGKITDGEHQNPPIAESGKNLIMAKDVLDDHVDFSVQRFVSENDYLKYVKKCNPEVGDVVLVSRGATVGRCCVVNTSIPFCLMGSVILVKKGTEILGEYLCRLLKHSSFSKELVNVSSASAQQAIYISHLKKLRIPLPPLPLQQKFAEVIENIEHQKAQAEASGKESEGLFQSLLQSAFKGEL